MPFGVDAQVWNIEVAHNGWWKTVVLFFWHPLVCKVKGHKWEVIGECTPNHGYYGRECSRCGEAHGEAIH